MGPLAPVPPPPLNPPIQLSARRRRGGCHVHGVQRGMQGGDENSRFCPQVQLSLVEQRMLAGGVTLR
jgi:hypothetical protein